MGLFNELKRRNVIRVGFAYAVVAWVLLQVADLAMENFAATEWVMKVLMLVMALGFPVALNGGYAQARSLMAAGVIDVDAQQLTGIDWFLNALEDPEQIGDFELFYSATENNQLFNNLLFTQMLTALGSPRFFDSILTSSCRNSVSSVWAEPFRDQRGTPEFFSYMESIGVIDYWRKFGWPDDCASLDQSLAECD